MSTSYTFYVSGMHCTACKHLIEEALLEDEAILGVNIHLSEETVTIETAKNINPEEEAVRLTALVSQHGYKIHTEKPRKNNSVREWSIALPLSLLALLGFIAIEQTGLTSFIGKSEGTYVTALLVGLVASISTCLALVGGLVLSVSATLARNQASWRPQAYFHIGRLAGFFILGGLLGLLGEVLHISFYGSTILGAIASVVMLILGIHLLDISKNIRALTLPRSISQYFTQSAGKFGKLTPAILGASTFFLPCGLTQSMQITSLSSGSFSTGAFTMLVFALGTFPVLALLSFGSLDLAKSHYQGIFFKTAGVLVILFALFNLQNILVVFNLISPLVSF